MKKIDLQRGVVFSYCDFGPHVFSHEKGRSHVEIFIKWAEVNASSTAGVNFGHLGTAERTQLITDSFTMKSLTVVRNFNYFYHFAQPFNFTSGFRPKYGSNRKVFCRNESF